MELREWSRLADELARERTRLANRMRSYYPQFLDAVDGDPASAFALALWKRPPNPGAGAPWKLLARHGVRRIDMETLRERLLSHYFLVSHYPLSNRRSRRRVFDYNALLLALARGSEQLLASRCPSHRRRKQTRREQA